MGIVDVELGKRERRNFEELEDCVVGDVMNDRYLLWIIFRVLGVVVMGRTEIGIGIGVKWYMYVW